MSARPARVRCMGSCSRLTTGSRSLCVIGTTREGANDRRRRRRRRHLHRLLQLRRKRQGLRHRQGALASRRRGARVPGRAGHAWRDLDARLDRARHDGRYQCAPRAQGRLIGLITTRGFRDVIEMRRRDRRNTWGLWGDFAPVVDRALRLEVSERTLASGEIRAETDPEEVRAAARTLLAKGAEALAIVFINAYANPSNELAALAAATSVWPNENLS